MSENAVDMVAKGRNRSGVALGERNPNAKLTAAQVSEIRRLYIRGKSSELALRFGVVRSVIIGIAAGKQWKSGV